MCDPAREVFWVIRYLPFRPHNDQQLIQLEKMHTALQVASFFSQRFLDLQRKGPNLKSTDLKTRPAHQHDFFKLMNEKSSDS